MEVLILLIFVSVVLVALAVGLFVWSVREHTLDHSDRLALKPLDEEKIVGTTRARTTREPSTKELP